MAGLAMGLKEYKGKRDFTRTSEPSGTEGGEGANIFVVHEHHATRLHWDLRLAMDGVLKSWAIPKEPPTSAGIKRLAVQVEDHPLEYADFEGTIPKGEYGAGTVKIWDKGEYKMRERSDDKYVLSFHGKRLIGDYYLLRFKRAGDKNWLFFAGKADEKRVR